MKRLFIALYLSLTFILGSSAETLFPYPTPPESLTTLSERANYLIEHFWERCNMKNAFSSRAKLADAFGDYVSFMPFAQADTVYASIGALINQVKKDPNNLLTLAKIAEETLYGDSAIAYSDEAYLPFARAIAECKKIPAAERARFQHQAKVLSQSQVGMSYPVSTFVRPDGSKGDLNAISAPYTLIFINDPDCDDCRLARARLSTDLNTRRLVANGTVALVSIYPDKPDDFWLESIANYPSDWVIGASAEIDDNLDLRHPPVFYFLDKDKKIIAKNIIVDNILRSFTMLPNQIAPTEPNPSDADTK